jgi:hypothetical protein
MLTAREQAHRTNSPHLANYSDERAMTGSTLVVRILDHPEHCRIGADAYRHGKHGKKRESGLRNSPRIT